MQSFNIGGQIALDQGMLIEVIDETGTTITNTVSQISATVA
jgi:hypothetical protein